MPVGRVRGVQRGWIASQEEENASDWYVLVGRRTTRWFELCLWNSDSIGRELRGERQESFVASAHDERRRRSRDAVFEDQ